MWPFLCTSSAYIPMSAPKNTEAEYHEGGPEAHQALTEKR
jgi:hypothetical protein